MNRSELNNQDLDRIRDICEEAGIKLTHQRLEIFKELMVAKDHPSAEEVHRHLQERMPTVALDTVYRTLSTFDELGIAKKLHLANKSNLFDTNLTPHHHFICELCGKVEDVYWSDFDTSPLPEKISSVGEIRSRHLELYGVCKNCLE